MNCPVHIGCVSFNLAPQQLPLELSFGVSSQAMVLPNPRR